MIYANYYLLNDQINSIHFFSEFNKIILNKLLQYLLMVSTSSFYDSVVVYRPIGFIKEVIAHRRIMTQYFMEISESKQLLLENVKKKQQELVLPDIKQQQIP